MKNENKLNANTIAISLPSIDPYTIQRVSNSLEKKYAKTIKIESSNLITMEVNDPQDGNEWLSIIDSIKKTISENENIFIFSIGYEQPTKSIYMKKTIINNN